MGISLGGQKCLSVPSVVEACLALGRPVDGFVGKASRFMSPLGDTPGRGWALMTRQALNALDLNALLTLTFQSGANPPVIIPNVTVVPSPACVIGSNIGNVKSVYLVEVADARWLAENPYYAVPVNKQYNVRAPAGAIVYYEDSTDSGAPWTWQTMLDDLWSTINLVSVMGTSPVLPFTPDGTPESFKFIGCSAWAAYNSILRRLCCGIGLDYTNAGAAYIAQVGAVDLVFALTENKYIGKFRKLDEDVIDVVRGKIAENVVVYHHYMQIDYGTEATTATDSSQWSTDALYSATVGPVVPIVGVQSGSVQAIFDDLPALLNYDDTLNNSTELASRDAERAADYFRIMNQKRMHRLYVGLLRDRGFLPGAQVSGVTYMMIGKSYFTEVINTIPSLRVSDQGQWVECWDTVNERLKPPDFGRVTYPIYPEVLQEIKVGTVTSESLVYNGIVQNIDPDTKTKTDFEDCYVWDPNGGSLSSGDYVGGRLNGQKTISGTKRSFYLMVGGAGGGGSSLELIESDGTPDCTDVVKIVIDSSSMFLTCDGGGQATIGSLASGGSTLFTAVSGVTVASVVCNEDGSITVTLSVTTFQFRANPP